MATFTWDDQAAAAPPGGFKWDDDQPPAKSAPAPQQWGANEPLSRADSLKFKGPDYVAEEDARNGAQPSRASSAPTAPANSDFMAVPNPKGLLEPGHLPIWHRPNIQNDDGTHSSEFSFSREENGKEVLVPSIVDGKWQTPDGKMPPLGKEQIVNGKRQYVPTPQEQAMYDKAWQHYKDNPSEHLGKFDNADNADAYANALHSRGPNTQITTPPSAQLPTGSLQAAPQPGILERARESVANSMVGRALGMQPTETEDEQRRTGDQTQLPQLPNWANKPIPAPGATTPIQKATEQEVGRFRAQHPIIGGVEKGVEQTAEGLRSPANLALLAAAPESKIISAFFAAQASKGAFDSAEQAYQAFREGKNPEAAQYATEAGLSGIVGALAGAHAIKGSFPVDTGRPTITGPQVDIPGEPRLLNAGPKPAVEFPQERPALPPPGGFRWDDQPALPASTAGEAPKPPLNPPGQVNSDTARTRVAPTQFSPRPAPTPDQGVIVDAQGNAIVNRPALPQPGKTAVIPAPAKTAASPAQAAPSPQMASQAAFSRQPDRPVVQASNVPEQVQQSAGEQKPALEKAVEQVASSVPGAELEGSRVKDAHSIENKEDRGKPVETTTDVLGARVSAPEETQPQLEAKIEQQLPVVSKDKIDSNGLEATQYGVKTGKPGEPNQVSELQVVTPQQAEVMKATDDLYDKQKEAEARGDKAEAKRLGDQIAEKFQAVLSKPFTPSKGARIQLQDGRPGTVNYFEPNRGLSRVTLDDGTKMPMVPTRALSPEKGQVAPTPQPEKSLAPPGAPLETRVDQIKQLAAKGTPVTIFTARAGDPQVKTWLQEHGLGELPVTNVKGHDFGGLLDNEVNVQGSVDKPFKIPELEAGKRLYVDLDGTLTNEEKPEEKTNAIESRSSIKPDAEPKAEGSGNVPQEKAADAAQRGDATKQPATAEPAAKEESPVGQPGDGEKPEEVTKFKFGNTQADIPRDSEAAKALVAAQRAIDPADLVKDVNGADGGLETTPHVTVRYGIKGDDTAGIRAYLEKQAPFEATLGKTQAFPASEHSDGAAPIIAPVESPDLRRMEAELDKHGDFNERSFPDYKPHATVAYVKAGEAKRYTGMTETEGKKFTVSSVSISKKDGSTESVELKGGTAAPVKTEEVAAVTASKAPDGWGVVGGPSDDERQALYKRPWRENAAEAKVEIVPPAEPNHAPMAMLNPEAYALLRARMHVGSFDWRGYAMNDVAARFLIQGIRNAALGAPEARSNMLQLARTLEAAQGKGKELVLLNQGANASTIGEEQFHAWQHRTGTSSSKSAIEFASNDAIGRLTKIFLFGSYPPYPADIAAESTAKLVSGGLDSMNLPEDQRVEFLQGYLTAAAKDLGAKVFDELPKLDAPYNEAVKGAKDEAVKLRDQERNTDAARRSEPDTGGPEGRGQGYAEIQGGTPERGHQLPDRQGTGSAGREGQEAKPGDGETDRGNGETARRIGEIESRVGSGFLDPELFKTLFPDIAERFKNWITDAETPGGDQRALMRETRGERDRMLAMVAKKLEGPQRSWIFRSREDSKAFFNAVEGGDLSSLKPKDQALARAFRGGFDALRKDLQDLNPNILADYIENYFPHIWQRPSMAAQTVRSVLQGKRPFAGKGSFLKQRTIPTIQDGLDMGLTPVSWNPVDLFLRKYSEMSQFLMAQKTLQMMKEAGTVKMVRIEEKAPDGWQRLDDRIGQVHSYDDEGHLFIRANYFAPPDAAKVFNNYVSRGLAGRSGLYDILRWANNNLNSLQLGISAFHASTTAINAATSEVALGIQQLSEGKPIKALGHLISGGAVAPSVVRTMVNGSRMMKEYLSPGSYKKMAAEASAIAEAGGRAKMDVIQLSALDKTINAFRNGAVGEGLLSIPGTILQTTIAPVMDWMVPRMKLGAFYDMAHDIFDLADRHNWDEEQIRSKMQRAWDSIDNRFGQLVYDNLFWHKALQDTLMLASRSVGWNFGDLRELGGAAADVGKQAGRAASGKMPEITPRMSFAFALPLVTGLVGAALTYLWTGQKPDTWKDYFYPKRKDGTRVSIPGYMKDVVAIRAHPFDTIVNKMSPLFEATAEAINNRDFYGTEIRHKDDSPVKQFIEVAKWAGEQMKPFSFSGTEKLLKNEGEDTSTVGATLKSAAKHAGDLALGQLGFQPAPAYIQNSPALNKAREYGQENRPSGTKTQEQTDHQNAMHAIEDMYHRGDVHKETIEALKKSGAVSEQDVIKAKFYARTDPLTRAVRSLSPEQSLNVYKLADDKEKKLLRPVIEAKSRELGKMTDLDQRNALKKAFHDALNPQPQFRGKVS